MMMVEKATRQDDEQAAMPNFAAGVSPLPRAAFRDFGREAEDYFWILHYYAYYHMDVTRFTLHVVVIEQRICYWRA